MGTAEVAVFTTQELWNNDNCDQEKIKNYIKESFSHCEEHSVNVYWPDHHPDPPVEAPFDNFTDPDGYDPCGSETDYPGLLDWWNDYHPCKNLFKAADSNILVTNDSGLAGRGGLGGSYSVASGSQIKDFKCGASSTEGGCSSAHDAMQTIVHEIGHNLGLEHADGNLTDYDSDDRYYTTNMMNGYAENLDSSSNNCGNYVENIDSNDLHCNEHKFSECAEDKMTLS